MTIRPDFGTSAVIAPDLSGIVQAIHASARCAGSFADEETIRRALSALQRGPIHFHRDKVIACEGEAADYIFVVVSGVVRSCKTYQNGSRGVVAFYLPGDLFGWDDAKCSLSIEAATDVMVLFLKRRALLSLAARDSRIGSYLLAQTTKELGRTQQHSLLMGQCAKSRVATFLTDLWTRLGKPASVDLPMLHQDIADYLGLTIETLSRTITSFEQSGMLKRQSYRKLVLRKPALLSQLID
jgi:CRP/FNR family transcriptional regulator, nitrogen fixation regulation protein